MAAATKNPGWRRYVLLASTIGLMGCENSKSERSPNLHDPVINQYFYTAISSIPPDWIGDILLLSPLQLSIASQPWWALYAPTNFLETGPLGDWKSLTQLSHQAATQGRAVGCDLVLQHTASLGAQDTVPRSAPPFSQAEIGDLGFWGWNIDYRQASARLKAHSLVEDYASRGVRFLRYDAAHMIPPAQLAEIILQVGHTPEVMQVLELAGGRHAMMEYLSRLRRPDVRAFDFSWTASVNQAVHGQLGNLMRAYPLPYGQTVLPVSTHDFFVMGGIGTQAPIDFSLLRFFALTAYSLPTQVLTTDHALPNNLTQVGIHSTSSMKELKDLLLLRAHIQHQPLFWLRTGNPDVTVAYQRGDSHLFALSRHAAQQSITVEHVLRPGSYRELFSGRLYTINEKPIVLTHQTENRYAFVRVEGDADAASQRPFTVPPVMHMIWCQGVAEAPSRVAADSFREIGLEVTQWDCQTFERDLLPRLTGGQKRAYERLKEWEVTESRHRWMMLSDFMRLAILAHRGGYYSDWDSICHWPFQSHFQDYELVVAQQEDGRINNAFIAASTGSRVIQHLLETATDRILSHTGKVAPPVCWPAGPDLFTQQIQDQLGTLVLPPQVYISYQPGVIDSSCYVSHFYASVCGDQIPIGRCPESLYGQASYSAYAKVYSGYEEGIYGGPGRFYGGGSAYYGSCYYGGNALNATERGWRPFAGKPPVPAPDKNWVWIDAPPPSAEEKRELSSTQMFSSR